MQCAQRWVSSERPGAFSSNIRFARTFCEEVGVEALGEQRWQPWRRRAHHPSLFHAEFPSKIIRMCIDQYKALHVCCNRTYDCAPESFALLQCAEPVSLLQFYVLASGVRNCSKQSIEGLGFVQRECFNILWFCAGRLQRQQPMRYAALALTCSPVYIKHCPLSDTCMAVVIVFAKAVPSVRSIDGRTLHNRMLL